MFARNEAEEAGQMSAGAEAGGAADECDEGCRGQQTDAGDGLEGFGGREI